MFWGVKLDCGKQYSQLVERSFHVSHAALQLEHHHSTGKYLPHGLFEVHAIVEKTDYILCYLGNGMLGKHSGEHTSLSLQQPLNLNISEGEEIILYVRKAGIGDKEQQPEDGSIYLTGYFVDEPTFAPNLDDLLDDDEYALEEELSEDETDGEGEAKEGLDRQEDDNEEQSLMALLLEGSLVDSDSENDDDFVGNLDDDLLVDGNINTRKRLAKPQAVEEIKEEDKDDRAPPSKRLCSDVSTSSNEQTTSKKKNKKKKKDSNGDQKKGKAPEADVTSSEKATTKKLKNDKKLPAFKTAGGTEVQELKIGSGKIAKPGTKAFVKYTGRLAHNKKIFDSNITQRKPFMFRLGQGEVIKGWDEGVNGMRIGGKRKLLIPPKQGYGASGVSGIPPNSKLLFDVELVDVK